MNIGLHRRRETGTTFLMRTNIDHLPQVQQDELARVVRILMAEFEEVTARATQPWRRNGKIYKVILFGSYARDDWVDEPENGYQSDFDLLIVVSHRDLTEIADYWYVAEDKILRDPAIGRPVNIIVHSIDEVNQALRRGEYFWVDIVRDGIAIYELPQHELTAPMPASPRDAYEMASGYFLAHHTSSGNWLTTADWSLQHGTDRDWRNKAAFALHQATETAYACFLLVRTLYFPRSHNIKFLRSLAEDSEPRLIEAWPRATKIDRRRFELLKRAYVEARYSASYEISRDDLEALTQAVRRLRDLVEMVSRERLEELRIAASAGGAVPEGS
ncbi:MAG TPA: HEPN domain-containing protein [Allosphingosinicella sp.]|nr:HEPN domain-containing protein [Allosphingosinicella sp.]